MTPEEIDSIVLTDEEVKEAIRQAKIKKYHHEKHAPYWLERDPDLKEKGSQSVGMKVQND